MILPVDPFRRRRPPIRARYPRLVFKKTRTRIAAELRDHLGPERIVALDDSANFFGVESKGKWQMRGNGVLAAADAEIVFVMWFPRREVRVPRDRVTGIERVKWHLGKSVGRTLLLVRFTNEQGRPDSVAWLVRDLDAWETALRT
jgi:hypothetical protein